MLLLLLLLAVVVEELAEVGHWMSVCCVPIRNGIRSLNRAVTWYAVRTVVHELRSVLSVAKPSHRARRSTNVSCAPIERHRYSSNPAVTWWRVSIVHRS
uniref:Putative secreted peptide n=1 Tax=Anopheles braziliensis TaxID=58242 RepID=A0A2M3ZRY7_9DIPT